MPDDYDRRQLHGVLLLRTDLSSSTGGEDDLVDQAIQSIALPVPDQQRDSKGRYKVLPGAPLAFATRKVDGYRDSQSLLQWCRERGDFQPSVLDRLQDYFSPGGAGQAVRSFVSRPLSEDDAPFGVLNLHADRPDILGPAPERREVFLGMLTPFVNDLTSALLLLIEAECNS